jgi:guanylate cyclase, other
LHLIRDCWADNPAERPNIGQVRSILRSTRDASNANLMDHVFNMLEQYATRLEQEVDERTRELVEEKKKSDILLYRMLPK